MIKYLYLNRYWYCVRQDIMYQIVNSLWPSEDMWWQRSGSVLAHVIACCLTAPRHYVIQCWLSLSPVRPSDNHLQALLDEIHYPPLSKLDCQFHTTLHGAYELIVFFISSMSFSFSSQESCDKVTVIPVSGSLPPGRLNNQVLSFWRMQEWQCGMNCPITRNNTTYINGCP